MQTAKISIQLTHVNANLATKEIHIEMDARLLNKNLALLVEMDAKLRSVLAC